MESPTTATVCPWGLPPLTESVQWGVVVGQETGCAEAGTTLKPRGNPHARPSATRDFFMVFRGYASGPNTASSIVVRTPGDWPEGRQGVGPAKATHSRAPVSPSEPRCTEGCEAAVPWPTHPPPPETGA